MLIQGKYLYFGDDLSNVHHIRNEVFCKEIGLREEDELDNQSAHVIVYSCDDSMKPVATGRIYFDGNTFLISKVCVLKEERNKYYGDFVVRMLASKAFLSGAKEVIVESFIQNIEFYEKIGFIVKEGKYKKNDGEYIKLTLQSGSLCKKCTNK